LSAEGGDPEISAVVVKEMSIEVVEKKAGNNNPGGGLTGGRSGWGVGGGVDLAVGVVDGSVEILNVSAKFWI
jgi:hypothetical protein